MPTSFVRGDLFARRDLDGLAHGCNCAGAMGKGIAMEFRARFPAMYTEYKKRCSDGRFALGDVFAWREGDLWIFNLGTQKTWRTKAEISAIAKSVRSMVRVAEDEGVSRIGMPRIGAGLGGLAWAPVRAVLGELGASRVELVVFEEYAPSAARE